MPTSYDFGPQRVAPRRNPQGSAIDNLRKEIDMKQLMQIGGSAVMVAILMGLSTLLFNAVVFSDDRGGGG